MNILVCGGAGYIGSHTVKELKKRGHNPIVFDNLEAGHKEAISNSKLIIGDLSDYQLLKETLINEKIDAVIHFAGYIDAAESVYHPEKYYENNVVNTITLLNCMNQCNIKKIIFSSSAAVYGIPKTNPVTEDAKLEPINSYGETKLVVERILHFFEVAHNFKYIALRYFNVSGADIEGEIGPERNPPIQLITKVIKSIVSEKEFYIFGNDFDTKDGTGVRDYIHVTDLAQAHILALGYLERNNKSNIFIVGSGNGFSVTEIIDMAQKTIGKNAIIKNSERRAGDPPIVLADISKIKKELGWEPKYSDIKTIISKAYNWHKMHPNGYK